MSRKPALKHIWPGDFNRDGITDLVAGGIVFARGRGDGTFDGATGIGVSGFPLGVGDFNRDGRPDVVAWATVGAQSGVFVIPGNGDGTFAAPRFVDALSRFIFAMTADLNGDGHRDIVLAPEGHEAYIYPGNGDFTFGPRVTLAVGAAPNGGIIADFDNDADLDIVIASRYDWQVDVFVNQGAFLFAPSTIRIGRAATDVTSADLNGDGKRDLLVSATGGFDDGPYDQGFVFVMHGNGDGTFQPATTYETAAGAVTIVAGDFNRDGKVDVATGNRSAVYQSSFCGSDLHMWDSLTVLPGTGSGTLAGGTTFSLGTQRDNSFDEPYRFSHHELNTSDLNGDRQTDLIASPGVIILNAAATPNRAPVAFAGEDQVLHLDGEGALRGGGFDADEHRLSFRWSGNDGRVFTTLPDPCFRLETGTHNFTLTVDDEHGGTSSDSVTVRVYNFAEGYVILRSPQDQEALPAGQPYTITWETWDPPARITRYSLFSSTNPFTRTAIAECTNLPATARQCVWRNPGPPSDTTQVVLKAFDANGVEVVEVGARVRVTGAVSSLPEGWHNQDVGAVGAGGSASYAGGRFTVRGSGADVWGTADEFHWASMVMGGHFSITTRVDSVENVNRWTKAGIMIRSHNGPGARHASMFATPTTEKGTAFQRRTSENGSSVSTAGPAFAPPVWLKLTRLGLHNDRVFAFARKNPTDAWTPIGSSQIGFDYWVEVGLAVSSHVDGRLASATFSNVAVESLPNWDTTSIGAVGQAGSFTTDGNEVVAHGSGADIWGTADAFQFVHTAWVGAATMTTRVRSIENTHAWAKAGVMFRASTHPSAPHVMVIVSPGKGVAMQYRATQGGTSANVRLRAGTAPEWLRLTRNGNTFTGYASDDGVTWVTLGAITVPMPEFALVGLPVTSHNNSTLATAVFDEMTIRR